MKDPESGPKFLAFHAEAIEVTKDGPATLGHVHHHGFESDEEVRLTLAEQYGLDPAEVHWRERGDSLRKGRIFGFGNWNGSKWEPAGPKGDPNLN